MHELIFFILLTKVIHLIIQTYTVHNLKIIMVSIITSATKSSFKKLFGKGKHFLLVIY